MDQRERKEVWISESYGARRLWHDVFLPLSSELDLGLLTVFIHWQLRTHGDMAPSVWLAS